MKFINYWSVSIIVIANLFLIGQAHAATLKPNCDIYFGWNVVSVGSLYRTYGGWNYGTSGRNGTNATDSVLLDKEYGYSNSVNGTVEVGYSQVSSSVGFDVTYSSSSTAQYSMTLLAGQSGEIDWRDVYSSKNVRQREYYRYLCGGQPIPMYNYAYCTANQWIGFGFHAYDT